MDILKMSKIEKSNKVLKNSCSNHVCDHNALKNKNVWNNLLLIFFIFFKTARIEMEILATIWQQLATKKSPLLFDLNKQTNINNKNIIFK
jgi:hypothetical protein